MKNIVLLASVIFAFSSCSDDDSKSGSTLKPSRTLASFEFEPDEVTNYTYDEADRLTRVEIEGNRTIDLTYNADNKLETIDSSIGTDYAYHYNADGTLTSITTTNDEFEVTFPEPDVIKIGAVEYTLTRDGDLRSFAGRTFERSGKKGAFANVRHLDQVAMLMINSPYQLLLGVKRPVRIVGNDYTNEYVVIENASGMPATYTVNSRTITFEYAE